MSNPSMTQLRKHLMSTLADLRGFHDQRGKAANKQTLGKREANATPIEFRDELLRLAMMAPNANVTGLAPRKDNE